MVHFKNENFKVMHITDTQDSQFTSPDTVRFIAAALDSEKPDLVVFSGDTVKGYDPLLKIGDPAVNTAKTIRNILEPLRERNTPFTFTFGNHDEIPKFRRAEQTLVYESYENCVNGDMLSRCSSTDCMCLPVYKADKKTPAFALWLIDNCGRRDGSNGVNVGQLEWMENTDALLREKNGGEEVPVTVFQHIPVYEMYEILKEVPKNTKGALEGNRTHRGTYYTVTDEMKARGEYMRENIACCSKDGEFEKWLSLKSVKAAFFGHDHINTVTGTCRGILLGYTPGCGFNVYGPKKDRAVRILTYGEDGAFATRLVTYRSLLGKKLKDPVRYYFYTFMPSSVDDAKRKAKKLGIYTAAASGAALAGAGAFALYKKHGKK